MEIEIPSPQTEMLETELYRKSTRSYLDSLRKKQKGTPERLISLEEDLHSVADMGHADAAKRLIKAGAQRQMKSGSDFPGRSDYLAIARKASTEAAVAYFNWLKRLNTAESAEATENIEAKIEELRQKVAISCDILLKQIETIVPGYAPPRFASADGSQIMKLDALIDFRAVERRTRVVKMFDSPVVENVFGEYQTGGWAGHAVVDGSLTPKEVLYFLNSRDDVRLFHGMNGPIPSHALGTVRKNGVVKLGFKRSYVLEGFRQY